MKKECTGKVTLEDAPKEGLTHKQIFRWVAYKNKTPAFNMWKCRFKKAGLYLNDEQYIWFGYDYYEDITTTTTNN